MNGYEVYKLFTALNNHFNTDRYDYFKYQGNINIKVETFENHRNRNRYESLAKKISRVTNTREEAENFIVANLMEVKSKPWIGSLGEDSYEIYNHWRGRVESFQYNLTNEIAPLLDDNTFNKLFECDEHNHPEILKALLRGSLSWESFIVLDMCINFIPKIDQKLQNDNTWIKTKFKVIRYKPFLERLNIDVAKLCTALQYTIQQAKEFTDGR